MGNGSAQTPPESLAASLPGPAGILHIPRRIARHLVAQNARPALLAAALGIAMRCLSRRRDGWRTRGRVKASWIAGAFAVDVRAVKAARRELAAMGWATAEGGDSDAGDQRSRNRFGRVFRVDLGWSAPADDRPQISPMGEKLTAADCHPSPGPTCCDQPPPLTDPDPPSEILDPEPASRRATGVRSAGADKAQPSPVAPPNVPSTSADKRDVPPLNRERKASTPESGPVSVAHAGLKRLMASLAVPAADLTPAPVAQPSEAARARLPSLGRPSPERPAMPQPAIPSPALPLPRPRLGHLIPEDLAVTERTLAVYGQAVAAGLVAQSEAGRMAFFGLAEHARQVATGDGCGLFVSLLRGGRWSVVTDRDEDAARRRLRVGIIQNPQK